MCNHSLYTFYTPILLCIGYHPDLIDYHSLSPDNAEENLKLAFSVAEKELGIPALLEPQDLLGAVMDQNRFLFLLHQMLNFVV